MYRICFVYIYPVNGFQEPQFIRKALPYASGNHYSFRKGMTTGNKYYDIIKKNKNEKLE